MLPADRWAAWRDRPVGACYAPEGFAADGFVHCTDGAEQVVATANRYYRADPRAFVVLELDLASVGAVALRRRGSALPARVWAARARRRQVRRTVPPRARWDVHDNRRGIAGLTAGLQRAGSRAGLTRAGWSAPAGLTAGLPRAGPGAGPSARRAPPVALTHQRRPGPATP